MFRKEENTYPDFAPPQMDMERQFDFMDIMNRERDRRSRDEDPFEAWTGRNFPESDHEPSPPPKIFPPMFHDHDEHDHGDHSDVKPRVPMGIRLQDCDDGKVYVLPSANFFSLLIAY